MKKYFQLAGLLFAAGLLIIACDKADDLKTFSNGSTVQLTASSTSIVPAPADSNKVALTLNWTDPKYATDSANYKFVIAIDSAGKNFGNPFVKTVMKSRTTSYLAKELNSYLVGRGYAFNVPVDLDIKLTSSYANNNELLTSNIVRIKFTPYKVPPKIALPSSAKLFIVGGATQGGWGSNPVPVPSQEFSRLDETTFAGVFQLNGGQSYLLLPVNGSWAAKYGGVGANNTNNPNGDDFKAEGGDMLAPTASGWYKITVDFQTGKFTVTPYSGTLATSLFIVGNATPGGDATGWDNPVPVPSQQFARLNSTEFELTIALNSGKSYLFLPVNGSWTDKYGGMGGNNSNNVNGDEFKFGGSDMLSPTVSGNYKINVNFAKGTAAGSSGKFTLTKL